MNNTKMKTKKNRKGIDIELDSRLNTLLGTRVGYKIVITPYSHYSHNLNLPCDCLLLRRR